jgi:hypothetical protein
MADILTTIIIHTIIGICIFVGFFIFYGKSNNWFEKGGLIYEWWRKKKTKKKLAKRSAQRSKRPINRKTNSDNINPINYR